MGKGKSHLFTWMNFMIYCFEDCGFCSDMRERYRIALIVNRRTSGWFPGMRWNSSEN